MPQALHRLRHRVEAWLEDERDQLVLWVPVLFGGGIAAWFLLPDPRDWAAVVLAALGIAMAGAAASDGGRAPRVIAVAALAVASGTLWVWWRADRLAAPILPRPMVVTMTGKVERIEPLVARELVRLTVATRPGSGLPPRIRVNLPDAQMPSGLTEGATLAMRARLMPPPDASVPGAYDFARVAWFSGIGATGRGFAPVTILQPGSRKNGLRARLTGHITQRLAGSRGGIAAALATGDEGAITQDDSDAMRRAGLAHLLSVSGLHITAAVGATMFVVLRLLALWPWLAIRVRLPLVAAGAGAAAAIGYTLLTGSQVPTIRSCVASLLVLGALAMGREAITLRLVAAGAFMVLIAWPEAVTGASFQLSFAAIAAIVALHEHPRIESWFAKRKEGRRWRMARELGSLLLTGLVVEAALMPIAVYHFHKAGVYGAAANIVAIPLTTFIVMPLEAVALLLDVAGLGWPVWWLTDHALGLLLSIAHTVADAPGSSIALPSMPTKAFAAMVAGGLWLALWRTPLRWWGLVPMLAGAAWTITTRAPDVLVTGDGRHVAVRIDGELALLRDRAGDYTRQMLAENGGLDGEPMALSDHYRARCTVDACGIDMSAGGRRWRLLATRSAYPLDRDELNAACRHADIVVSERRLPRGCQPTWLRLDAPVLRQTGGVAIVLSSGAIRTVRESGDTHPWRRAPTIALPGSF